MDPRRSRFLLPLAFTLAAFVVAAYGRLITLPFIADDYVFLDRVLRSSFLELWSRDRADFGWYRPWSRDLHFWLMTHASGLSKPAFRVAGFVLWTTALLLYAALIGRIAGPTIATIATLGAASLALWGAPLGWASGSQDLWMLVFSMLCLLLFVAGRRALGSAALVGALLSKETAAVVPLVALGHCVLVERKSVRDALREGRFLLVTVVIWLLVHPTLFSRTVERPADPAHPSPAVALLRSLLATVNLDRWPAPQGLGRGEILAWSLSAAILIGAAVLLVWRKKRVSARETARLAAASQASPDMSGVWKWGLTWAVAGLLPLLEPSTGWRAYYFGLGALGMWLAFATWLSSVPGAAIAAIASLALLRGAAAATPSYDWSEFYFVRAGRSLAIVRSEFMRRYPTLPAHTRIYLARVPNNIGLISGRRSALSFWYRDTTLSAQFYSRYRPRTAAEPKGADLFLRFDSLRVLVEVRHGPEDVAAAMAANPEWQDDHQKLAMLFLKSRDLTRAAEEFEKLSLLPGGTGATMLASVCRLAQGDEARSDSLLRTAQRRTGDSWDDMVGRRLSLLATMPRGGAP